MSMFRNAMKAGVIMKVAQVARRELAKPENQRKIREAVGKLQGQLRKPR